ncbi:MAG: DUF4147 domain-containing protein [Oscillospiraceae bacterium]|nr:DUF4147 domain-containing protein [Oscillospiraceae bacterium]
MNEVLRRDAEAVVLSAIDAVRPDAAVRRALARIALTEDLYLAAVGKAGWQMAAAAVRYLDRPFRRGIVLTKYGHVMGDIPGVICREAGHPVPDEGSFRGAREILEMTRGLRAEDMVLFLLSGGGSALFEEPLIPPEELQDVTNQLLACGADIVEMNTIRKRLSAVKGGRFARWCAPARVEAVILSDIVGDPLDMIASGPAAADPSTCAQAREIVRKYRLRLSPAALECLDWETPKTVENVHTQVIGSVRELCRAAAAKCEALGYRPQILTDRLGGEAREAGTMLARKAKEVPPGTGRTALIAGGETVVHLTGNGLGGRNQEIALAAAEELRGVRNAALISVGSDGTDGPTDAAGGYADGGTFDALLRKGIRIADVLRNNDAYHALDAVDCLIRTGPTGTNVNDVTVALIDRR